MGALGGVTVLTGFYLYWRLDRLISIRRLSATRSAMVFGTGGIVGTPVPRTVIGGSVVGRMLSAKMGSARSRNAMAVS